MLSVWLLLANDGSAQPFTFTQAAGPVRATNAVLHGMVVPNGLPTTAWFEWGSDSNYGQTTSPGTVGNGSQTVHISATVSNILSGPTYYYRVVASNTLGVIYGENQIFTSIGKPFTWGQIGSVPAAPANLSNVVAVAAGNNHCLALNVDGTITGWGNNSFGKSVAPAELTNTIAIAAGTSHSLALTETGIFAWGLNTSGETNVPADLTNAVQIAAGGSHSLALKADGTVVGWGLNSSGQTNVPPGLSNVVQVSGGTSHSLALKADGTVVAWGLGSSGQTNVPAGLSNVVAVAGANLTSLALKHDGTVVAWGSNSSGVTNAPTILTSVSAIAGGTTHGAALTRFGSALTWSSSSTFNAAPARPNNTVAIAAGNLYSVALQVPRAFAFTQAAGPISATNATLNGMITPNGLDTVTWFEWGTNGVLNQSTAPVNLGNGSIVSHTNATITALVAGAVYEFRVVASNLTGVTYGETRKFTTGRRVASWGRTFWGSINPPVGLSNVVIIATGDYGGMAIVADGTITTWGFGYPFSTMGVPPLGLSNIVAIAGGRDQNLALKSDRTVTQWLNIPSSPINLPASVTNVVAISSGDSHGLALRANGTLAGWGNLSPLAGLTNVVAISSGDTFCLGLKNDGTVTIWGSFDFQSTVPPPNGLRDVIAIAAGYQHALALRKDGTVVAWGFNSSGQINVPSGLTNVVSIAAGDNHCLALKADGTVVVWGNNSFGQQNLPAGLNDIVTLASGDEFCMALAGNTPPQPVNRVMTRPMNQDSTLNLTGAAPVVTDPNGDPISCRILSLPQSGSLYQFTTGGRGDAIITNNTPVSDSLNRLIFAPAPAEFGAPYTSFSVSGNDGEFDSAAAAATLHILPAPTLTLGGINPVSGAAVMNFTGLSNASYSVWATTDLINWSRLGTATQPALEQFLFTDTAATNAPYRFYQIRAP